jgi:hypothetical protein
MSPPDCWIDLPKAASESGSDDANTRKLDEAFSAFQSNESDESKGFCGSALRDVVEEKLATQPSKASVTPSRGPGSRFTPKSKK